MAIIQTSTKSQTITMQTSKTMQTTQTFTTFITSLTSRQSTTWRTNWMPCWRTNWMSPWAALIQQLNPQHRQLNPQRRQLKISKAWFNVIRNLSFQRFSKNLEIIRKTHPLGKNSVPTKTVKSLHFTVTLLGNK